VPPSLRPLSGALLSFPVPQQRVKAGAARRFCRASAAQGRAGAAKTLNLDHKSSLYRAGAAQGGAGAAPLEMRRTFVEMTLYQIA